jgi:hypothetical protein
MGKDVTVRDVIGAVREREREREETGRGKIGKGAGNQRYVRHRKEGCTTC